MDSLDDIQTEESTSEVTDLTATVSLVDFVEQLQETLYRIPKELRKYMTLDVYVRESDGSLQCNAGLPKEVTDMIKATVVSDGSETPPVTVN